MTRLSLLKATTARNLFTLDVVLVAIVWPMGLWLTRTGAGMADPRELAYPLANLLLLYAMGLYRREALVDRRRAAVRVPMVVAMGVVAALLICAAASRLAPATFSGHPWRDEVLIAWLAFVCFSLCAFAARLVLDILLRRRWLRRQLLVVGAGMRAWDLLRMLTNEGASLNYDITFLHDPAFGAIDPRLESDRDATIVHAARLPMLAAARQVRADQIVIAPDERRGMDLEQLLACKKAGFPVVQYLSFVEHEIRWCSPTGFISVRSTGF